MYGSVFFGVLEYGYWFRSEELRVSYKEGMNDNGSANMEEIEATKRRGIGGCKGFFLSYLRPSLDLLIVYNEFLYLIG
jgi:hypothetical protein